MRLPFKWLIASLLLCLAPAVVMAQDPTCPQIVEQALAAADSFCAGAGRNQACYGNFELTAIPQPNVSAFRFSTVGDITNVSDIQQMTLSPMDTASGFWGVALLKLQANLPDTLPGQNVTFLLFGDVELTNAVTEENAASGLKPMQAFYLKTGLKDSQCVEAPESGMLVQTPEGVGAVQFRVNGVDIQMGSTVFFQADVQEGMTVSTLEGAAYMEVQGSQQVIVPGTWARIPLRALPDAPDFFAPDGLPELPESYGERIAFLEALPFDLLERRIELAPPLTEEEVQALRQNIEDRLRSGEPLCGEDPFPDCEKFNLPPLGDRLDCVFRPRPGDPPLPASETRPFCPPVGPNGEASPPPNLLPPDNVNDNLVDDSADDSGGDDDDDDGDDDGDDD